MDADERREMEDAMKAITAAKESVESDPKGVIENRLQTARRDATGKLIVWSLLFLAMIVAAGYIYSR